MPRKPSKDEGPAAAAARPPTNLDGATVMLRLAARNLLRQKFRTAVTLAAIVFGVTGLILSGGFVQDIFIQLGEAVIHSQLGHLQVSRKGFFAQGTRSPEKYLIEGPDGLRAQIASGPSVKETMARISFAGLLNNGRTDLAVIGEGIEPDQEARLGSALRISSGRQLKTSDTFGALVGYGVAAALKLEPGSRVTLVANTPEGALNTIDLEVIGVFQSFSKDFDARAVRIPLAAAQELLGTAGVNTFVVSLTDTPATGVTATALENKLDPKTYEVKTWVELSDFYSSTVELYDRQFGVLRLIVLLMVLLSVANSVNMSTLERLGEFGTMQALGNKRRQVSMLIVIEGALLGLAGAVIGAALGIALAKMISWVGIPMPPPPNADLGYTARIRLVPGGILTAMITGVLASTLASLVPARKVVRMPIVDALRQSI